MPRRDTYWRRVHREAFRRARARVLGAAVTIALTLSGIVAAVWGLTVLGSEDAARDEILGRLFVAVASGVALIIIYLYWIVRIPSEWDERARKKIAALEDRMAPRLEFTWRANDNKYLDSAEPPKGRRELMKIGRVAVKNMSEAETLHNVEASLINYKIDRHASFTSIDKHLRNSSTGQQSTHLHARREANFNLFYVMQNATRIRLGPFVDGADIALRPGKYALKVTASAEDMIRKDALFFLHFDSFEYIEFRPWQPGDTSHDETERSLTRAEQSDTVPP
jgi:hypothetical protein